MAKIITLTFYRGNNNLSLLQPPAFLPLPTPPPPPPSVLLIEEDEEGKKEGEEMRKEEEVAKIVSKLPSKKNQETEENTNKDGTLKESVRSLKKSFFSFLSLDENFELDQDPAPQKKIHTESSSLPPPLSSHIPLPSSYIAPPSSHIILPFSNISPSSLIPPPSSIFPPPFLGLPNLGNTCFINSVVQAFCNLSQVKTYFQTEEPEFRSLAKSIQEFLNQGRKDSLIKKLKSCFPDFFNGRQHDAHEFFLIFLEKLNEELNKNNNQKNDGGKPLQLEEEENFWHNHSKIRIFILSKKKI